MALLSLLEGKREHRRPVVERRTSLQNGDAAHLNERVIAGESKGHGSCRGESRDAWMMLLYIAMLTAS